MPSFWRDTGNFVLDLGQTFFDEETGNEIQAARDTLTDFEDFYNMADDLIGGRTRAGNRFRASTDTSQSDSFHSAQMVTTSDFLAKRSAGATGTATDGDEVAIVPPPRKISKITPDYFTVHLPYYIDFIFNSTGSQCALANTHSILVRCNSIYDPVVGSGVNIQPHGRDQWASMFAYYRVLSSSIKVRWKNCNIGEIIPRAIGAPASSKFVPLVNNGEYMVGYEMTDSSSATLANNVYAFMTTKHAKRALLRRNKTTPLEDGTRFIDDYNETTTVFNYTPEQWDYHVQETGVEERWTPIKQNPTNDHFIALRAFHKGTDANSEKDGGIQCELYIDYVVQFREASAALIKTFDTTAATYGGTGEDAADTT